MNIKKHFKYLAIIILCSLSLLYVRVAIAENIEIDKFKFSAEPRHGVLDDAHLTIMGFLIGTSTLAEVQAKLGQAEILKKGENGPNQICYVSDNKSDDTLLVFEAGPLGGWKYITTFRIVSNKAKNRDMNHCMISSAVSKMIQTKSGIRLGINKKELMTLLGKPIKETTSDFFYVIQSQGKRNDSTYDINSYIHATFLHSKMISIMIGRTESN